MRSKTFRLEILLLAVTLLMPACSRSALGTSIPTASGSGYSPFPAGTVNSIESVQLFATQTAMVGTLLAGGGIGVTAVGSGTPVPSNAATTPIGTSAGGQTAPTSYLPSVTPTSGGTSAPVVTIAPGVRPAQYAIMSGEYPFCIARRFNVDPAELLALNPTIVNIPENNIPSGLVLSIPQTGNGFPGDRSLHDHPTTYTVPESMSVYRVACYFGDVDPSAIILANNLSEPYTLSAGQTLTIP